MSIKSETINNMREKGKEMNVAEICNRYIQFRNISAQIYNSRTFPSMVKEYEKYRFRRKTE